MKKIIIAVLMMVGSFSFANAQTTKKTVNRKVTSATATTTPALAANSKKTKVEKTSTHIKKDGTADKRFKENKMKSATAGPAKKNGAPDMRYKANKKK
ncbi:MAG: hypothetical protein ABI366_10825 [Ginsengibacter sp.]